MPRLAANVSTLFTEVGFLQRFAAARKAGFRAVEYQYPYDFGAAEVAHAAREAGVEVVLHNMPPGDPQRNERGTACLPGREQRFREDLERSIEYARAARCASLHLMAGVVPPGTEHAALHATYVANLRHAATRLEKEGMRLLIEPLSERTVANCFLRSSAQAAQVLEELGAGNAALQYDLFHMQIADVPGRHEPGSGEINFEFMFKHIDAVGYAGWIGCEYNPARGTLEGLKWAQPYL